MKDLSYSDRLRELCVTSLEKRRIILHLVLTYKIVFGHVDVDSSKFFVLRQINGATTRGNPYKLVLNNCRTNARISFFSERVTPIWNCLSSATVNFTSVNSFKRTIRNVDFSAFVSF